VEKIGPNVKMSHLKTKSFICKNNLYYFCGVVYGFMVDGFIRVDEVYKVDEVDIHRLIYVKFFITE